MNLQSKTVFDCTVIDLPKIQYRAGSVTPIQSKNELPFNTKRIFYLYDIPGGADRGAHAHKECHQFIVAASGSFEVFIDDGKSKKTILLNQPNKGIHIPPGIWASEVNFSSGAICLVIATHNYDENDYIRDYDTFLEFKSQTCL